MQSLPELILAMWGRKKAEALRMEYRVALSSRPLLLRDLAMICEVGAAPAQTAKGVIEQFAKQQVFNHISRMCGLKPEDFAAIADGRKEDDYGT